MEKVFIPQMEFSPNTLVHSFSLILTDHLELTLLPEIDRQLQKEAPLVNLQSLPASMDAIGEMRQGRADAAVTVRTELTSDINRSVIMQGNYVIAMRRDHPLAKEKFSLEKYADAEHIIIAPNGTQGCTLVDDMLAEHGLQRRVARKASTFLSAIQLASHSDYVVSLPEAAVHTLNSFANLIIVKPPFPLGSFDYVLIWHKRSEEDPSQRWFRQVISQCAKQVIASGLN